MFFSLANSLLPTSINFYRILSNFTNSNKKITILSNFNQHPHALQCYWHFTAIFFNFLWQLLLLLLLFWLIIAFSFYWAVLSIRTRKRLDIKLLVFIFIFTFLKCSWEIFSGPYKGGHRMRSSCKKFRWDISGVGLHKKIYIVSYITLHMNWKLLVYVGHRL